METRKQPFHFAQKARRVIYDYLCKEYGAVPQLSFILSETMKDGCGISLAEKQEIIQVLLGSLKLHDYYLEKAFADNQHMMIHMLKVQKGADLLDSIYPTWIDVLDVSKLNFHYASGRDILSLLYPGRDLKTEIYPLVFAGTGAIAATHYHGRKQPDFVPVFDSKSETFSTENVSLEDRGYGQLAEEHGFVSFYSCWYEALIDAWIDYILRTLMER